ncbi:hypothetical protein [Streptomyces hydrogenans]|uniref:hypothetical protein n=1 Tax=Streptomyces hydrogenans TaxID=1873719 RepID=UPI003830A2E4
MFWPEAGTLVEVSTLCTSITHAEGSPFRVWPASDAVVQLEREQGAILARWNECHDAGTVELETHPDQGGICARYDELALLLAQYRQATDDARRLVGEVSFDAGARYRVEGLDYWFRWRPTW